MIWFGIAHPFGIFSVCLSVCLSLPLFHFITALNYTAYRCQRTNFCLSFFVFEGLSIEPRTIHRLLWFKLRDFFEFLQNNSPVVLQYTLSNVPSVIQFANRSVPSVRPFIIIANKLASLAKTRNFRPQFPSIFLSRSIFLFLFWFL
jgi:hypothetical protein